MLTTPANYRIRVQGQLGPDWTAFFGGLTLSWQEPDQTVLVGQVVDQSALHGLLNTIRDLGLPLVEVLRLGPEESGAVDPWVPPGPALGCAVLRREARLEYLATASRAATLHVRHPWNGSTSLCKVEVSPLEESLLQKGNSP